MNVPTEPTWKKALEAEFDSPYFEALSEKITQSYLTSTVFPSSEQVFHALELCPFDSVRVVILGQDPYHGAGQAHGLAFSVPDGIRPPPSLKNIYKEIVSDVGVDIPTSGNLEHWAKQGVLLLNTTLTVENGKAGSHQGWGWETFSDAIIKTISNKKEHVVFLLWGKYAQAKVPLIDDIKHLILTAPHPSPFSAHSGFFGSKHFSKTNDYLKRNRKDPIIW